MITGVLEPLRAGRPVSFRPPGWDNDVREGRIEVPADLSAVIIEGVGVARRSLAPLVDVTIWVQSDYVEAKRRGTRRDIAQWGRTEEEASRLWDEWEAEEVPFLQDDQPWHRAHVIVGTSTPLPHDPETEVVVSRGGIPSPPAAT